MRKELIFEIGDNLGLMIIALVVIMIVTVLYYRYFHVSWGNLRRNIQNIGIFELEHSEILYVDYYDFIYNPHQIIELEEKRISKFVLTYSESELIANFIFSVKGEERTLAFILKRNKQKAGEYLYTDVYFKDFIKKLKKLKKKPQLAMIHLYNEASAWTYN